MSIALILSSDPIFHCPFIYVFPFHAPTTQVDFAILLKTHALSFSPVFALIETFLPSFFILSYLNIF